MGKELLWQTLGRFLLGGSKAAWPWMYIQDFPMDWLPWTLFLPWTVIWVWRRRKEDERMRLLLTWSAPAFIFFSICIGKRDIYLLPIYPALAIMSARSIIDLAQNEHPVGQKCVRYAWAATLAILFLAQFVLRLAGYPDLASKGQLFFWLLLPLSLWAFVGRERVHHLVAAQFGLIALAASFFLLPAVDDLKGARDFCRPLRELSEGNQPYRLYSIGFSREEYIFYSKHPHTPLLTDLLPVQLERPLSFATVARGEISLRKAIAKAVEKVPVASLTSPTDAEVAALHEAAHEAVARSKVEPELARAFEQSLSKTIAEFAREFEEEMPSFVFVQEEDWKWLLPLFPDLARQTVIGRQAIGRRNMLLLANNSGAALLRPGPGLGL